MSASHFRFDLMLRSARALLALVVAIAVGGCVATTGGESDVSPVAKPRPAALSVVNPTPPEDREPVTELTAELLYDVLVAAIAGQRRQPEVALEALSRAVYLSRDKRLNANAIQLALQLKDYRKAIEMARLMLKDEPDNFRIILALATAQVKSGQSDQAAETLIDLARQQAPGDEQVLQEIASLIARQNPVDRALLEAALLEAATDAEPVLIFTSMLLATRLDQEPEFRSRLERLLTLEPDWEVAAILKLTDLADQEGKEEEMVQWGDSYLKSHPDAPRFRVQYARLLIQKDDLDGALVQLDSVLEQSPESEDALFTAAVVTMDKRQFERAKTLFKRYIETSDNSDQARFYLAQILIEEEDFDAASPYLRQIQSRQLYLDAQISLSGVIARQSNVDAGLTYLRNIDVRAESDRVRLILEQDTLLRDFDQESRSMELLSDALRERPEQPDLLYSRGLLAAQLDDIELIERDMRKLIELQPDNAHAYNALGYTLADQTERYDEALELIGKALEFLPDDPFILDSMGWVNFRLGNNKEAIRYLQKAFDLKEDAEIAAHLGEVLWVEGNQNEAIKIWNKGKEWAPENPTLQKTMDRFLNDSAEQRARIFGPATAVLRA